MSGTERKKSRHSGAGGLAEELAARLRSGALAAFQDAVHNHFVAGGEARRRARDAAASALQAAATQLHILAAGIPVTAPCPAASLCPV